MKTSLLLSVLMVLLGGNIIAQHLNLELSENEFGVDNEHHIIVAHLATIEQYSNTSSYISGSILLDGLNFEFLEFPDGMSTHDSYQVIESNTEEEFTLFFTTIPIVSIHSMEEIVDEPKVLTSFTYYDGVDKKTSWAGIEIRGGYSQTYPKKTFDIELWEDDEGEESNKMAFGNMRKDDDWILDALYNEPLRIRSFLAHKWWLEMHQLYYQDDYPAAKSGADVEYVEVFLNGQYNGIYLLSEPIDKKQLQLENFEATNTGELYKGIYLGYATSFMDLPPYSNEDRIWGGHEMKYPKEVDTTDWSNLYEFVELVVEGTDDEFDNHIWEHFDQDNFIDYFIFLNLLFAEDNTAKNVYTAKRAQNTPYFYVPWDLDGCLGTNWLGLGLGTIGGVLSNGLYDRVLNASSQTATIEKLKNRWFELREEHLADVKLQLEIIKACTFLLENNVYNRETIVFPDYSFELSRQDYILYWTVKRLEFLDEYFGDLVSSENTRNIHSDGFIYPNPAQSYISFSLNDYFAIGEMYHIINGQGQCVKQGEMPIDGRIALDDFSSGIYWLCIGGENYSFVVERN